MSLIQSILFSGIILILLGLLCFRNNSSIEKICKRFPRSKTATFITMGIASAWFLWHIAHLSPADFGNYKQYLFIFFACVGLLSFYFVPDFLAVRGAAIIVLLGAHELLTITWMNYSTGQFMLNAMVYLAIIIALYLGAVPYRLRDFFQWLFARSIRPKILGCFTLGYGSILILLAFQ